MRNVIAGHAVCFGRIERATEFFPAADATIGLGWEFGSVRSRARASAISSQGSQQGVGYRRGACSLRYCSVSSMSWTASLGCSGSRRSTSPGSVVMGWHRS